MDTNKDNFRRKTDQISVQPSSRAWDKLNAKLDDQPTKKRIFSIRVLAIAASFLLLVGMIIWQTTPSSQEASVKIANQESMEVDETPTGIAIVSSGTLPYETFYEKVALARNGGLLDLYENSQNL